MADSRRKKTASERRAQQVRSDSRSLQKLLTGHLEVHSHRGEQITLVGTDLLQVLLKRVSPPFVPGAASHETAWKTRRKKERDIQKEMESRVEAYLDCLTSRVAAIRRQENEPLTPPQATGDTLEALGNWTGVEDIADPYVDLDGSLPNIQ